MSWWTLGVNMGPPVYERPDPPLNAAAEDYWPLPRQDRAQIPVIAHLVWPDREEWRATTARRWTDELVWVTWPPTATERGGGAWLNLEDVTRVVVKEREDRARNLD